MVSSEINFCMSSPKNERLIPEIIYKCIQFLFSSSSFLFFLSCQTFFWSPFQRGLFYDSYSSWTAGCTTQLTLTLKSSWKCCLHFCFLINPKFIIWKLFWDRVNISLILACIHCLSSFHCTSLIGVWLCFSTPTQYLQPAMNLHITHHPTFSQSFHLQAEQAQLPQPPLSHHGLQALAILVGLHWTHPKELLFILFQGAPKWMQNSRCSLTSTHQPLLLVCWTCTCSDSPRCLCPYSNRAELPPPFL